MFRKHAQLLCTKKRNAALRPTQRSAHDAADTQPPPPPCDVCPPNHAPLHTAMTAAALNTAPQAYMSHPDTLPTPPPPTIHTHTLDQAPAAAAAAGVGLPCNAAVALPHDPHNSEHAMLQSDSPFLSPPPQKRASIHITCVSCCTTAVATCSKLVQT